MQPSASILMDPLSALRATRLFRDVGELVLQEAAAAVEVLELAAGAALFGDGERIDALCLLAAGRLDAVEPAAGGGETLVRSIRPGEAVDPLQVLAGSARPVTVRVAENARLVRIPGDAVDRLAAEHPEFCAARDRLHRRQLLCRLHPILGPLDEEFLDDLERTADWLELNRGELLFEQDEESDGLYFVIGGRVQALRVAPDGGETLLSEAGRGDTVGEVGFFTGGRRRARVRAVRDSLLVGFSGEEFEGILAKRPRVLRHVTRGVVERLQRPVRPGGGRISTIAVVPVTPGAPLAELTARLVEELERFGPVVALDAAAVDRRMDEPGIAEAWEDTPESERLLAWLEACETRARFVVYRADPGPTAWTRRALRQADRILLVASADDDPAPGELERALLLLEGRVSDAHELLVLLHPPTTRLPAGTRRWLEARPHVEEHHHLRTDRPGDYARLARNLAGRAVGLVLGGGGARGFAHIGVLRAMEEAGIPIDAIGGTSMGAGIAAHHALGMPADQVKASNRRIFLELKPHHDFTLPVFSFVGARKAEEAGWKVYGTTEIEDLWIPYFCVSSDLSSAEMVVHRRGLLWKAALASASLPAFTTPVLHEGHLLVDGALLNNLPSDVMRRLGPGVVIASEVSVEEDDAFCCDRIPTSWEALKGRWWGKKGEKRFPSLMEVVLRSSLLHSTWRERMSVQEADLCLRPPVEAFGLLDFERLDDLVAIGYDYARGALAAWAEEGGPLPRETATPAEVASVLQAALAPGA